MTGAAVTSFDTPHTQINEKDMCRKGMFKEDEAVLGLSIPLLRAQRGLVGNILA